MVPDEPLGEVLFEFHAIGNAVKVTAVQASTGIEASIVGSAQAPRRQLELTALAKLRYVLKQTKR